MGFLFHRTLNHFQDSQSAQSTTQPNDDNDDDNAVDNDEKQAKTSAVRRKNTKPRVVVDTNALNAVRGTAFVYVAVDGLNSQLLEIEVKEGDDVLSIKDKIKENARPAFDSVAIFDMELFESERNDVTTESDIESVLDALEIPLKPLGKALSALDKWNSNVTWGTVRQPLIVEQIDKSVQNKAESE